MAEAEEEEEALGAAALAAALAAVPAVATGAAASRAGTAAAASAAAAATSSGSGQTKTLKWRRQSTISIAPRGGRAKKKKGPNVGAKRGSMKRLDSRQKSECLRFSMVARWASWGRLVEIRPSACCKFIGRGEASMTNEWCIFPPRQRERLACEKASNEHRCRSTLLSLETAGITKRCEAFKIRRGISAKIKTQRDQGQVHLARSFYVCTSFSIHPLQTHPVPSHPIPSHPIPRLSPN